VEQVLTPSRRAAARLFATYATRGATDNGGEQEVWANFHGRIHELPLGYNAHHGLEMAESAWRHVHTVHAISGHQVVRLPDFLRPVVQAFNLEASSTSNG
jgi:hypothetical protein